MEDLFYFRHNLKGVQEPILPHTMNFFEITAVFDGSLCYTVDGSRYTVSRGDLVFVKKGVLRERDPITHNVDFISLNFASDAEYDFPVLFRDCLNEIIRPIFIAMDAIHEYTSNARDERFSLLLRCILRQLETQLKVDKEHPLVFKIKSYVKKNLQRKITLASVSESTFFSPVHCENVFKKETGSSIIDYVLGERIREAKALITERSLSLQRIAEAVGFTDYNYFSRVFKKRTGLSPKEYSRKSAYLIGSP